MLGLKILLWVVLVVLVLCLIVAIMNSVSTKPSEERQVDMMTGAVLVALVILMIKMLGEYLI